MKKIIVLNTRSPWLGQNEIRFVMWASVPTARQSLYTQTTAWQSIYASATTTELASLRAGEYVETVQTASLPTAAGAPVVKNVLEAAFTAYQSSITNEVSYQYYGTYYEGTVWTLGGV